MSLFADDSNLLTVSPSSSSVACHVRHLQSDLDECVAWSNSVSASFNPRKCVHMNFEKAPTASAKSCSMSGIPISIVESHRHLGVTLCSSLKFDEHMKVITSKFHSRVFLFSHMCKVLPHGALSLFCTNVISGLHWSTPYLCGYLMQKLLSLLFLIASKQLQPGTTYIGK